MQNRPNAPQGCAICRLHGDPEAASRWEIGRSPLWLLRHHPDPVPLAGWLLLDARRHLGGPLAFNAAEAAAWGAAVSAACLLVQQLSGCERVYSIAFGEGARHLHLHLIPRHAADPRTEAWAVADLYRAVAAGHQEAAAPIAVAELVERARNLWPGLAGETHNGSTLTPWASPFRSSSTTTRASGPPSMC